MESKRVVLVAGEKYSLHSRGCSQVLECIKVLPGDVYSDFNARVRSVVTGWTINIHGVNMYEDGSIDWDFSTNGIFTTKDDNGILHEERW